MNKINTIYKTRISPFVLGCLLFVCAVVKAQDSIKTLTLEDCLKIAATKSTEFLKGSNAVASAGADVMRSYGQFLPDLNLGAGYNYTSGKNLFVTSVPTLIDGNKTGYNYQLVSSINIFNG